MADTESHTTGAPGAGAPGGQHEQSKVAEAGIAPAATSSQAQATPEELAESQHHDESQRHDDDDAAEIEGELGELVKTAAQRDEYLALAQRTQADFENYRKRVARDAALAQDRGVAKLAKELLPALDNLDRAIEAATLKDAPDYGGHPGEGKQAGEQEDPLLAGVRLVRSEIAAALARGGIEAFTPLGEPFDPNQQEAMAQQPVEGAASGTVAEVYQDGYRMGDTIIRPARVLVAA
ncbi:MAG: nucleotide exchange factor GrpE [Solirubrobacteraceae bacterium]